jgi:hypothetical protein
VRKYISRQLFIAVAVNFSQISPCHNVFTFYFFLLLFFFLLVCVFCCIISFRFEFEFISVTCRKICHANSCSCFGTRAGDVMASLLSITNIFHYFVVLSLSMTCCVCLLSIYYIHIRSACFKCQPNIVNAVSLCYYVTTLVLTAAS